jgi:predicted DNA-binding transcriptional regulator AlpA
MKRRLANLPALVEILMGRPLLTIQDLARRYQCLEVTVSRWHVRGSLPRPIKLPGSRIPLWRPCDIDLWERKGVVRGTLPRCATRALFTDLPQIR